MSEGFAPPKTLEEAIARIGALEADNQELERANLDLSAQLGDTRERLAQAEYERDHDSLTKLLSRRAIYAIGQQTFSGGLEQREEALTALAFVDIDYLHEINRVAGKDGGDEVIVALSEMLTAAFRKNAVKIGRPDGDEILIICYGMTEEQIARRLEGVQMQFMQRQLRCDRNLKKSGIQHGFCFGIATGTHGDHFSKVLAQADRLCTVQKRSRNITRRH